MKAKKTTKPAKPRAKAKGKIVAKSNGEGWFTVKELLEAWGKSEQAFFKTWRFRMPEAAVRMEGQTLLVFMPAFIEELVKAEAEELGGASPSLERFRDARAEVAEMERDERKGELVKLAEVNAAMAPFLMLIRRATESLQRKFGPEAGKMVDEAITQAEEGAMKALDAFQVQKPAVV